MYISKEKIPTLCSFIAGDTVIVLGIVIVFRYVPIPSGLPTVLYTLVSSAFLILVLFVQWFICLLFFSIIFLVFKLGNNLTDQFWFYDGMMNEYKHPKSIVHIMVWAIGIFSTSVVAMIPSNNIGLVWIVATMSLISIWCVDLSVLRKFTPLVIKL